MMRWMLSSVALLAVAAGAVYTIGALLPRTHTARRQGVVARPLEQVAATIREVRAYPQWRSGITVDNVAEGADGITYVEGGDERIAYRLTEPVPNGTFVATITDDTLPFGGRWTFTLTAAGAGTLVRIQEDGVVSDPLYRFFARFVFGYTSNLERYLRDLGASEITEPAR